MLEVGTTIGQIADREEGQIHGHAADDVAHGQLSVAIRRRRHRGGEIRQRRHPSQKQSTQQRFAPPRFVCQLIGTVGELDATQCDDRRGADENGNAAWERLNHQICSSV